MTTFRFKTRISRDGMIKVPPASKLLDKEVEVLLIGNQPTEADKKSAGIFLDKWVGVLSSPDSDKAKFDYLAEKYK